MKLVQSVSEALFADAVRRRSRAARWRAADDGADRLAFQ